MQACFTGFLRTFCKRLKSQYGRDVRLGTKISQVEQFCAEVGQHLLVRPHTARSAIQTPQPSDPHAQFSVLLACRPAYSEPDQPKPAIHQWHCGRPEWHSDISLF